MKCVQTLFAALVLGMLTMAIPAQAAVLPFSGTITGVGFGSPDSSCAPAPARGVLNPATSTGTSTLGSFTYGHDWCFYGANGPINGTFDLFFGADALQGTVTGLASPTSTPGVASLDLTYTILTGTGIYNGATGSFAGLASADTRAGNGSQFTLVFNGIVNSVPEPATWALMLLGFAAIGTRLRGRIVFREIASN